ncbi:MAG: insulinase family protein [Alphaproteobacteria bacterium]|nr:insulinase family protein [Alphaproteobacteria bacterium]
MRRYIFLLIFCLVIIPVSSVAKEADKVLDIQEVTSPGGLTAWFVQDQTLPIISLKFSFKGAGAVNDGQEKQGLARMLSNTLDEGAGDLTSQEFQKSLSDHSITLSFGSGRDHFGGSVKTLSRNKDKAFELLKLALNEPRFDPEPVERMRQANLKRIKSNMGNPDWIVARLFNDIIYEDHLYALNSGGTLTTLAAITADDLRQYKKDWLTKDRLLIAVTGDITKDELGRMLDDVFGSLPESGKKNNVTQIDVQNQGKVFTYNKDIPQTILEMALPSFPLDDPDYPALKILNYIYGGGGFGSRLMEEAREKRGLTYGIYSAPLHQEYMDAVVISTSTKNETAEEILDVVRTEIQNINAEGVTKEELQDAKSYLVGSLPLSLSSTEKISSIMLSLQLRERSIDYLNQYKERLHKVTLRDIGRVAKRILDIEKMVVLAVGKPEGFESSQEIKELPNVE